MKRLLCLLLVGLLQVTASVAATFRLDVEVTPQGSGSLNTSGGTYEEGASVYLRTYNNTGYVFKGWYEGEELVSSATSFNYTMPQHDVRLQAKYEFDPTVPGNPAMPDTTTYYRLTATVSPVGAGTLNTYEGRYACDAKVYMRTYGNTGYRFLGWQNEDGTVVSTATSFDYAMPRHDSQLTALYEFDPSVPANPDSMATNYTVYVKCKPVGGGSFNNSAFTSAEGSNVRIYAYTNTGYRFIHWENENGNVIATDQNFYYVIPHGNSTVYGVFEFDPAVPGNPNKNYWNKELGELIIDDFTTGSLNSAASSAISGSSSNDVTMITVAGRMNSNDFGIANNYKNCTLLDISRVTGVTEVPSYAFDGTNLETVYLPATIEKIGDRAFENCKQLAALTLYAMTPPALGSNIFRGIPEGLVVYVPAASIAQYQEAAGWKDFTILPIQEDIRSIAIALPEGFTAADFTGMWLELTNTKSGQRLHYVMTERQQYTFPNIIRNTTWNILLRNERGDVFGQINGVEVKDEDVSVTFDALKKPQTVVLSVLTPDGTDVTGKTQITWLDADGNYLAQSTSMSGLCAGKALAYRITLPQELAMAYVMPGQAEYTVAETSNNVVCTLEAIAQVALSGKVLDVSTRNPLSGAVVSASQTFAGKYSKTVSAKTDAQGNYTLAVLGVPTTLSIASPDYISQTLVCDTLMDGGSEVTLNDVALKPITGATVSINFTYRPSVAEDEEAEVQEWYSDYNNVTYNIYNKTKARAITQFNVQYPRIVLLEEVDEDDVLELTATSVTSSFVPVKSEAKVSSDMHASATFDIVALGGIKASFKKTDNAAVVGSLYDSKGKLVKSYNYANAALTVSNLADGNYTLVSMGASTFFNNVYDLAQLPQTGLLEGKDYVKNTVEVKSGVVSVVDIEEVPVFDESQFYYTGAGTSFTVNKPSIVAGNYLTLTARIDFKQAYATSVSNLCLVVDLPESCQFVENSVMVGNSTSSYALDGNRLTIPMLRYTDRVRFCVIPTLGGDYAPSALASFSIEGKDILQPIGSVPYTVQDLSISVPATTYTDEIAVTGTANGRSDITVYDNDVIVGTTKALANGTWSLKCKLTESRYLDNHNIYATAEKDGMLLRSVVASCIYDPLAIKVSKVTMVNTAHPAGSLNLCEYVTVFDFLNPKPTEAYWYWPNYPDFSFKIDFTKNDTCLINSVNLVVHTTNGEDVVIPSTYSEKNNCWIAEHAFKSSSSLPSTVSVQYDIFGADLSDDATYEAMVENLLGDYKIESDTLSDGSRDHRIIAENGDTVGVFNDKIVDSETAARIEDVLKEEGYVAEYDSIYGKLYVLNDSLLVYIVPEDTITNDTIANDTTQIVVPEPVRRWWILTIKVTRSYDKELESVTTNLGYKWTEHITKLEECLKLITYIEKQEILTRYLYKITKTWMYKSVLKVFEDDELVYQFTKIIRVIHHLTEVEYKREIVENVVKTVAIPVPCPPYPTPTPEPYPGPPAPNVLDPSGYVYEAVSTNRLQGVTATAYYKETVEDMYGDLHENIVKWDAEEYAQENPLFTDENGMYAWDVPQGLWQVKFEKEGYETTYSEWLPVPPPQLDVNIAMKQNIQPTVKAAHAYEDAVELEFDKYMMPELLNVENIIVQADGQTVEGTVQLLNEEVSYEGKDEAYASRIRFNAAEPFDASEISLLVSNRVKSYAGVRMQDDYMQTFTIEKELSKIVCDSAMNVIYGDTVVVPVAVMPAVASAGKTLTVRTSSSMILSVEDSELTINDEGMAYITVIGELPGTSALTFSVEEGKLKATTIVNVVKKEAIVVAEPKASIASGTVVEKGTKLYLTCPTEGATIFYTTDGSCPCDLETALVYDGPIVINESMTIKAIAMKQDMYDSEVVEFNYTVAVEKIAQEIVWTQEFGDVEMGSVIELTAEATSGLAVAYTITNGEELASLDGNKLTLEKEGVVVITATQDGNETYLPAESVTKTINTIDTGIDLLKIGDEVELEVYDLTGLVTYQGKKKGLPKKLKGLYIVKSEGKTYKVLF